MTNEPAAARTPVDRRASLRRPAGRHITGQVRQRGFTLAEIAIAILVMSLLGVFGLTLLTNTQAHQRRVEAQRQLEDARAALIGFAIVNGRLPCPATSTSTGTESFAPLVGSTANGWCTAHTPNAATQGLLPARQLGLPGVSSDGLLRDPWGQPVRYALSRAAVAPGNLCSTSGNNCLFASNTMTSTISSLPASTNAVAVSPYLLLCDDAACATPRASDAAVLLFSGVDAAGAGGADETENLDGDVQFIYHEPRDTGGAGGRYAHQMLWIPTTVLIEALARAGRL